jgi:hypothetical protein
MHLLYQSTTTEVKHICVGHNCYLRDNVQLLILMEE